MFDVIFSNRTTAGKRLADRLQVYARRANTVVIALPRGGVPIAYEIAKKLKIPLDILLVRKLGLPGQEELAMGAIASGGIEVLNHSVLQMSGIKQEAIDKVKQFESQELERRARTYRGNKPKLVLKKKTVIVTDDGIATGATMKAALEAVRTQHPEKIILAIPVAPAGTLETLKALADEVICLKTPEPFFGIGQWYGAFPQLTDDEVIALLQEAGKY